MKSHRILTIALLATLIALFSSVAVLAGEGPLPNQIPDRQALAEYHAGVQKRAPQVTDGGQITDRAELAAYQATLGELVWYDFAEAGPGQPSFDQIADRGELAAYQATLASGDYMFESIADTMFAIVPPQ